MCVTICGRFRPDEGAVAGYGNRIRVKSPAKWGVQIAGMIFQTRSKAVQQTLFLQSENSAKQNPFQVCTKKLLDTNKILR
ncbi:MULTISPECIES: DUF6783 domain-containing protein [unclassified Ruminococcus]|uniref:DUF6783 domain-containing protein n=1 Tax=unclassified Ruminococcus TaxID=2608920 RepID=UPI00319DC9FE